MMNLRDVSKDSEKETPPPRVWEAEKYNVSDRRLALNRWSKRAYNVLGAVLGAVLSFVGILLTPLRIAGRLFLTVYWRVEDGPRAVAFGIITVFVLVWAVCFIGSFLSWSAAGSPIKWWEIPCIITSVAVVIIGSLTVAVIASLGRQEWAKIRRGDPS